MSLYIKVTDQLIKMKFFLNWKDRRLMRIIICLTDGFPGFNFDVEACRKK